MLSSVSNISFRANEMNAQDLISSPGQFASSAPAAELPADSFEMEGSKKKKSGGKKLAATLLVALGAFAGLGYAVKKGHLEKTTINDADSFFKKLLPKTKNLGHTIGEYAVKCWDSTIGKLLKRPTY